VWQVCWSPSSTSVTHFGTRSAYMLIQHKCVISGSSGPDMPPSYLLVTLRLNGELELEHQTRVQADDL
jgi:hypothetical protein